MANDLIKNPEFEKLVSHVQELESELASLVCDRDVLIYHTCPALKAEYMLKLGKLEYAIYEYQCKIRRTKRKIEIIRSFKNRDQSYNIVKIDEQLDKEYEEYTQKLLEKQKEIDDARDRISNERPLTKEESSEIKKLYTQIVKKLHPDINSNTTEEERRQFSDAVEAYKKGDLAELRVISLLSEKTSFTSFTKTTNSMDILKTKKEMLLKQKKKLADKIQEIKNTFPYNIRNLLLNKIALENKIDDLSDLLNISREQYKEAENKLEAIQKEN